MNPNFSIIIPTYNRADRIAETIQSVILQSYHDFELIIVDDGSTDQTEDVVNSIQDNRIKYYKKINEERAIARNFGIDRAKGDYITFLDSDDKLYPHYFDEAFKIIHEYNNPEWLHLAYEIKDEKGKVVRRENKRKGNINKTLITGNHLSCIGVIIRKDIIKKHRFNEDPDIIGSEDYLLWLELTSQYQLRYSNVIAAYMVNHSNRSVINFNQKELVKRIEKSIEYVFQNQSIRIFMGKMIYKFRARRYLYLANHLSRAKYKISSLKYYFLSISNFPVIIFSRNSLSFLKSLFLLNN